MSMQTQDLKSPASPAQKFKAMISGSQDRKPVIKGVIFDLDGVLLDSMSIWTDLGAGYLQSLGIRPEEGLGDILFSMSMEQGAEYLNEHYLLHKTSGDVLKDLQGLLQDFYFHEVKAKPGAKELLMFLSNKGIKITAATSSPRAHVERALERNGLLKNIERIFTVAEVGVSKHSPDIYDAAAEYMGLKREEVLVFEDSLYALKTAHEAGFITAGVYDADGEKDQEGVAATGDIYLRRLQDMIN